MAWARVGEVSNYFAKIGVAVVVLDDTITRGDWLAFVRHKELVFEQEALSMQIDYRDIDVANAGQMIALKVKGRLKPGTDMYKAVAE